MIFTQLEIKKFLCKIFGHDNVHVHTDYHGKTMIITIYCLRCQQLTSEKYFINLNDLYFE